MRKSFFGTVVLAGLLCVLAVFASCDNKNTAGTEAQATEEQFEPDARFASIDTLVDVLTQKLNDNSLDELVNRFDSQLGAMKSYWYLNHKGGDESRIDEDVCSDLTALADSLSGGSTFDMMRSNNINCAVSRYLTTQDYCKNYRENPLYQAEMSDWLKLEEELSGFYCDLASLANWGGSIVNITSSGAVAYVAKTRQDDYSQLKKGGNFAGSEGMTISEARANLIQELEDAKSLEDDMDAGEDFKTTLNNMRGHADKVVELLDKWLESRAKLCETEGIPESHTALFISKLGQRIMELIEG